MHSRERFASLHGKEIQIVTQPCMARQVILAWQGNWECCKALHGTASNLSRTKKIILDKILARAKWARAKCRPALHGKASIPCMARTLKVVQSLAWQGYIHSEWRLKRESRGGTILKKLLSPMAVSLSQWATKQPPATPPTFIWIPACLSKWHWTRKLSFGALAKMKTIKHGPAAITMNPKKSYIDVAAARKKDIENQL